MTILPAFTQACITEHNIFLSNKTGKASEETTVVHCETPGTHHMVAKE